MNPKVTNHALDRYREHWPTATIVKLLTDFESAYPAPIELVLKVAYPERLRRDRERHEIDCIRRREWFAVTADYRGAFALRPAVHPDGTPARGWAIVTYLRFDDAQVAHLRYRLDGKEEEK